MKIMKLKIVILFSSLLCIAGVNAQMNITIQLQQAGLMQKQQLWNLMLVYTGNTPINARISLNLLDASSNNPVLKGKTNTFTIGNGAHQYNAQELGPVLYEYFSPAFSGARLTNDFLPVGNYLACYTIESMETEMPVTLLEDCLTIEVEPLQGPMLTMPETEALLETRYPQFSWIPPVPMMLFENLLYEIRIVELLSQQSDIEAFNNNVPVYNSSSLSQIFYNYSASNLALDKGL